MPSRTVAKVIVSVPTEEVLLLRRSLCDELRPGECDFPGGGVEDNETPEKAARREVFEEAGIDLGSTALQLVLDETMQNSLGIEVSKKLFVAKLDHKPEVKLRPEEHDSYAWQLVIDALETFDHAFYNRGLQKAYNNNLLA